MSHRPSKSRPHEISRGFIADGPGFYVWEETEGEALRRARELEASLSPQQAKILSGRQPEARSRR